MDETTASAPELIFVGSYAGAEQPGIHAFHFDAQTGALVRLSSHAGIDFPSFVAVHPSRRWLYAVSETSTAQNGTPGAVVEEGAIRTACDGVLAKFKQPKRVAFVEALPRNSMGKIQKTVLRDTYRGLFAGT